MIKEERHIINMSGGKDSTALAIYLKEKILIRNMNLFL